MIVSYDTIKDSASDQIVHYIVRTKSSKRHKRLSNEFGGAFSIVSVERLAFMIEEGRTTTHAEGVGKALVEINFVASIKVIHYWGQVASPTQNAGLLLMI